MPEFQPFDLEPPDPHAQGARPLPKQPLSASHNPSYAEPGTPPSQPPQAIPEPEPAPRPRESIPVGIPIEQSDDPPSAYSMKDLDVCPNCGAPMRGPDTLVCTRCGFNLKTMKLVRTVTGVAEVAAASTAGGSVAGDAPKPAGIAGVFGFGTGPGDDEEQLPAVSRPGRGDQWLPFGVAGLCGLILLIAYLAGVPGLFPGRAAADITFGLRAEGLLRFIVMTLMWTGCGFAGLMVSAHFLGMRIGDWTLAACRMLAIASVMQLIRLVSFTPVWLEHIVEIILQLSAFAGLSLALFHIKPKDLSWLVGSAVALFLFLWMGSAAIVWATTGS